MTTYAIASRLVGFATDSLRVRVTRREAGCVWCVTADISNAGTPLVLDASQVADEQATSDPIHRDGLVVFA